MDGDGPGRGAAWRSPAAPRRPSDAELVGPATLVAGRRQRRPPAGHAHRQGGRTPRPRRWPPIAQEGAELVIPYAAVVYDADGKTWVYTSPKPLTFVRSPITVARIAGDKAFLSAGPGGRHRGRDGGDGRAVRRRSRDRLLTASRGTERASDDELDRPIEPEVPLPRRRAGRDAAGRRRRPSSRKSKVDVFPEFAPPKVEVQTLAIGLTASEVEELVTVPLEQALQRRARTST